MRITRLYIDNYKCFVGFDFKPQAIQPIFGLNGTGKSTLFEVLDSLKRLVSEGLPVDFCFKSDHFTRWHSDRMMTIRLEVGEEQPEFVYEITISLDGSTQKVLVHSEELSSSLFPAPLVKSSGGNATIYDETTKATQELLSNGVYSPLSQVNPGRGRTSIAKFKTWLVNIHWIALHPGLMRDSSSNREDPSLVWGGSNFVSWFRSIAQTRLPAMGELNEDLGNTIDGFHSLRLVQEGKQRILRALMRCGVRADGYETFDFGELSDGQRILIALYAVLHGLGVTDAVLLLDEPANYLALAEIQPYLVRLRDAVGDGLAQLFVVTHNSEAIDYMAPDGPAMFVRGEEGAVRIESFPEQNPKGLSASQLMALGWERP